jgi:hypothetical protein
VLGIAHGLGREQQMPGELESFDVELLISDSDEDERPLSLEEFNRRLAEELAPDARRAKQARMEEFMRRYPMPAARSAYAWRFAQSVLKDRK